MATTYHSVNMNQHTGFCVLRRQDVTVDGNSPTLIPTELIVAVEPVHDRRQLGAKEEDVNTTEVGDVVERIGDGLFQGALSKIGNHVAADINGRAALQR